MTDKAKAEIDDEKALVLWQAGFVPATSLNVRLKHIMKELSATNADSWYCVGVVAIELRDKELGNDVVGLRELIDAKKQNAVHTVRSHLMGFDE